MNILGIETATERLGVALVTDGGIFSRHLDTRSAHCERLAGFIAELAAESGLTLNDIHGIAVSAGPGSFTGLRIGIATAMGIAYGLGVEICAVGTLAALAWNSGDGERLVCPLLDAKRQEAYTGVYRTGPGVPEEVIPPAAMPVSRLGTLLSGFDEPVVVTGPAAVLFRPLLEAADGTSLEFAPAEDARPSAIAVARLGALVFESGGGASPAGLQPVYLRRSDAEYAKMKRSEFCG